LDWPILNRSSNSRRLHLIAPLPSLIPSAEQHRVLATYSYRHGSAVIASIGKPRIRPKRALGHKYFPTGHTPYQEAWAISRDR
jgi:hypothetical protein